MTKKVACERPKKPPRFLSDPERCILSALFNTFLGMKVPLFYGIFSASPCVRNLVKEYLPNKQPTNWWLLFLAYSKKEIKFVDQTQAEMEAIC